MMNWVTLMMTSCLAAHPGIPWLAKPFCPCFCCTLRKVIPLVFQLRKIDPSSTINSTAFDIFSSSFWTERWLYFVSLAECVLRDCPHECLEYFCRLAYFSCFGSILFSSIASIILCLISCMYLICGWSTFFFFKGRGCALCAVSTYRLEIMVYGFLINTHRHTPNWQ